MRAHPTCLLMPSCEQTSLCIPTLPPHAPLHHIGVSMAWTFPSVRLDWEAPGGQQGYARSSSLASPQRMEGRVLRTGMDGEGVREG